MFQLLNYKFLYIFSSILDINKGNYKGNIDSTQVMDQWAFSVNPKIKWVKLKFYIQTRTCPISCPSSVFKSLKPYVLACFIYIYIYMHALKSLPSSLASEQVALNNSIIELLRSQRPPLPTSTNQNGVTKVSSLPSLVFCFRSSIV